MFTIAEKIKMVKELCEKHEITSYELGEHAEISQMSAYNILTGKNLKPKNKTLNIIINYIEKKITGSQYNPEENLNLVEEPKENLADTVANKVLQKLKPYLDKIELQDAVLTKLLLELSEIKEEVSR